MVGEGDLGAVRVEAIGPRGWSVPQPVRVVEVYPKEDRLVRRSRYQPAKSSVDGCVSAAGRHSVHAGSGLHPVVVDSEASGQSCASLEHLSRDEGRGRIARLFQAFGQRRKMLHNALQTVPADGVTPLAWREVLEAAGVDGTVRGETLEIDAFVALANAAAAQLGHGVLGGSQKGARRRAPA